MPRGNLLKTLLIRVYKVVVNLDQINDCLMCDGIDGFKLSSVILFFFVDFLF